MAKQGYHHGNLRQTLVDGALTLIETKGPAGFTLSQAAKSAGVTPAAVYRHFAGRDDLISEAARQGYVLFADRLEAAAGTAPRGAARIHALARAYLAFARSNPGHYIAMFESNVDIDRQPELARAAGRARALMHAACDALCPQIAPERCPEASLLNAHIWALSHGVVELFLRNSAGLSDHAAPEDMLEAGLSTYLRGLGVNA
ncbi:TetR/AcrR family transcriptional regulator [uncultured Roseovarius sp.]|uniref:TetR/AcrR family transcriptional regulator n=1 Tax=Roseovarius sp. TaxID=1486281 RepID=UPI0025E78787|nr:TetR/AcrR family transcriptional regulator [uncultured Roseovarius sp.]